MFCFEAISKINFCFLHVYFAVYARYVGHISVHTAPSTAQVRHLYHASSHHHKSIIQFTLRTWPCPLPPGPPLHPPHLPLHHLLHLLLLLPRQSQDRDQEQDIVIWSYSSKISKLNCDFCLRDDLTLCCQWYQPANDILLPCDHVWIYSKINRRGEKNSAISWWPNGNGGISKVFRIDGNSRPSSSCFNGKRYFLGLAITLMAGHRH